MAKSPPPAKKKEETKDDDSPGCCQYTHWGVLIITAGLMVAFKPSSSLADIPGDVPGSPLIGHAVELLRDDDGQAGWLAARCEKYGTASRIYVAGVDVVLLCGHKMAKDVFLDPAKVEAMEPESTSLGLFGSSWLPVPRQVGTAPTSELRQRIEGAMRQTAWDSSFQAKLRDGMRRKLYGLMYEEGEYGTTPNKKPFSPGHELAQMALHSMVLAIFGKKASQRPPDEFLEPYVAAVQDYMQCLPLASVPFSCFNRASRTIETESIPWMMKFLAKTRKEPLRGQMDHLLLGFPRHGEDPDLSSLIPGPLAKYSDLEIATAVHLAFLHSMRSFTIALSGGLVEDVVMFKFKGTEEKEAGIGYDSHEVILEAFRKRQPTSFSFGVAKADFMLSAASPNRDCHADCPSCPADCEPKVSDLTIPAGTKFLMAWHTVATDEALFPDPHSFVIPNCVLEEDGTSQLHYPGFHGGKGQYGEALELPEPKPCVDGGTRTFKRIVERGPVYEALDYVPNGGGPGVVLAGFTAKIINEQFDFQRNATGDMIWHIVDNGRFKG